MLTPMLSSVMGCILFDSFSMVPLMWGLRVALGASSLEKARLYDFVGTWPVRGKQNMASESIAAPVFGGLRSRDRHSANALSWNVMLMLGPRMKASQSLALRPMDRMALFI